MKFFRRIAYQLYLFQLENYNIKRSLGLLPKSLFPPQNTWRQKLVWTAKLKILFAISLFLFLFFSAVWIGVGWHVFGPGLLLGITTLFGLILFTFFYPLLLLASAILIHLPERYEKNGIVARATATRMKFPKLQVIGIAGSYGKTTMKEMVSTVLTEKFRVLKTPENINTPLGIARLLEEKLNAATEILVVEMGEYERGDIETICRMVKPQIGIITGINEAHLERMMNMENTVATIFELSQNVSGRVIMNADDALVVENYGHYVGSKELSFYGASDNALCDHKIRRVNFMQDGSGYVFEVEEDGKNVGEFRIALLGEYAPGTAMAGILVGKEFGIDLPAIREGIRRMKTPEHRLEIIPTHNKTLVIDDSYNGNPAGATAAINVLNKFKDRRRIYITPGLVEMGTATERVHHEIGKQLGGVADFVVLIKNSVTEYLLNGLRSVGFDMSKVAVFDSAVAAHSHLKDIVKTGDVVLFQNDWPDNYF